MGMYTGLKGTITFKPEMAELLKEWDFDWQEVAVFAPALEDYSKDNRSNQIPYGGLSYMPSSWDDIENKWVGEITYSFACSLKNYERTISKFISILPEIADAWDLEELYEECNEPTIHKSAQNTETKIQQLEKILAKPVSDYEEYSVANRELIAAESDYKEVLNKINKYRDTIAMELLKEKEKQNEYLKGNL